MTSSIVIGAQETYTNEDNLASVAFSEKYFIADIIVILSNIEIIYYQFLNVSYFVSSVNFQMFQIIEVPQQR